MPLDESETSRRSLPYGEDDDYFYYHGCTSPKKEKKEAPGADDGSVSLNSLELDEDEQIDHVGALISPSTGRYSLQFITKKGGDSFEASEL